jgi:hypothetical protein
MKVPAIFFVLLGVCAIPAIPAFAHHSLWAEFDPDKPIRVTGIVTNVDWMNPHTFFFVDVKDLAAKKVHSWACQLASPNELARRGFKRDALKIGMSVTVVGTRAKDGSFKIHTETLSAENTVLLRQ